MKIIIIRCRQPLYCFSLVTQEREIVIVNSVAYLLAPFESDVFFYTVMMMMHQNSGFI